MAGMDYLDFELEIGSGSGRDYPVAVLHSPAGEARTTMRFPFDQLALESRLKDLQIALLRSGGKRRLVLTSEEQAIQALGRSLFDALLSDEIRSCYDVSAERALRQGCGLRIKLRIHPPELVSIPWEFLYDPRRGEYVCLSTHTSLVRYIELPQPPQVLQVTRPLRILGLVARPKDLPELDVTRERERVERALAGLIAQGLIHLDWMKGQTWRDLQRSMRSGPWHIFYFGGHGGFDATSDEGLVALAREDGRAHLLPATQLARLLADHRTLRLVVLNSCEGARGSERDIFSSTASVLVRRGIPAVLAMQYEITDDAAIEFARSFYEALADGYPVDAAASEARKGVSVAVNNSVEWGTPVLYMRSSDGVLFDLAANPSVVPANINPQAQPSGVPGQDVSAVLVAPFHQTPEQTLKIIKEPSSIDSIDSPVYLELVRVPAGPFLMGSSPEKDPNSFSDERPQHPIDLAGFLISKYPITVAQFAAFLKATGYVAGRDSSLGQKADHPVTYVSHHDAQAFCGWLSECTGRRFRLPTEAEWEKAARGTDDRRYPWGNTDPDEHLCNFANMVGDTTPVSNYPAGASPYGALDMAGNVWEWTSSLKEKYPYEPLDGREYLRAPDTEARALRGGSLLDPRWRVRSAYRYALNPDLRGRYLGFRVAANFDSR